MERYIRDGLPHVLEKIEKSKGQTLTPVEKSFIFGARYAEDERNFMLIPGDKIAIREIADYVGNNMLTDENHSAVKPHFRKKNFKPKNTVMTIIGLLYGDPLAWQESKKEVRPIEDMKKRLLEAVSKLFSQLNIGVLENNPDSIMEMIHVEYNDSMDIKGSIKCIFCTKPFHVFCKQSKSSTCTWVVSNFKRHIISCSTPATIKDNAPMISQNNTTIEPVIESQTTTCDNTKILSAQMIVQTIKMLNSKTKYEETTSIFTIESNDEITVCEMEKNGNCLFSAISHQVKGMKNGTAEHMQFTDELRNECVEFIRSNLDEFERDICSRIIEKFPEMKNPTALFS